MLEKTFQNVSTIVLKFKFSCYSGKMNVVINGSVSTGKESPRSGVKILVIRTAKLVPIHRLHVHFIFKEPQLCIFLTGIDYLLLLAYITLRTCFKCL